MSIYLPENEPEIAATALKVEAPFTQQEVEEGVAEMEKELEATAKKGPAVEVASETAKEEVESNFPSKMRKRLEKKDK